MSTNNNRPFTSAARLLLVGLVLLCLVLIFATWVQGPRVRLSTINTEKAILTSNQRLQLHLNQSIGKVSKQQIAITPNAAFTVASGGNMIVLQFNQPLRADTTYKIKITTANQKRVFSHQFTTASADILYAANDDTNGRIYKQNLAGGRPQQLFRGSKVLDFAAINTMLIVHTQDVSGKSVLLLRELDNTTAKPSQLSLPQDGIIADLQPSPDGRFFGFRFTANDIRSGVLGHIAIYELATGKIRWVQGLDGKPIKSLAWQWARDSSTILAQTYDLSTFIVRATQPPLPVGQFSGVSGFSWDSSTILAANSKGRLMQIKLENGAATMLPPENGSDIIKAIPLNIQAGYIFQFDYTDHGQAVQQLSVERGGKRRSVYRIDNQRGYIRNFITSNNDQYVAVQRNDSHSGQSRYDIIDTFSGKQLLTLPADKLQFRR